VSFRIRNGQDDSGLVSSKVANPKTPEAGF
jgi:hypothetical protein